MRPARPVTRMQPPIGPATPLAVPREADPPPSSTGSGREDQMPRDFLPPAPGGPPRAAGPRRGPSPASSTVKLRAGCPVCGDGVGRACSESARGGAGLPPGRGAVPLAEPRPAQGARTDCRTRRPATGPDPTQALGTPPPHGGYPAARLGVLGTPPRARANYYSERLIGDTFREPHTGR